MIKIKKKLTRSIIAIAIKKHTKQTECTVKSYVKKKNQVFYDLLI